MNILISGAAGYLGSTMIGKFLDAGHNVTGYDNLYFKQASLLSYCHHPAFEFVYGDVRDFEKLLPFILKADVIIPLAAIVGVGACDLDPKMTVDVNVRQVRYIANLISKNQVVIYPNTNSGYGIGQDSDYCTEETPLSPISLYGKTKCEAEKCVLDKGCIALRLATVFGVSPRMRLDLLVNDFTYKAMTDGYIVLFEKHFKRNYIHVRDVASAFLFMIDNYDCCRNNVYNLGLSSANLSKYELAMKIKEQIPNFSIQCDEIRKDLDKRNYIVSNDKIERTGWMPQYTLERGIEELRKAYSMLFRGQQVYSNV